MELTVDTREVAEVASNTEVADRITTAGDITRGKVATRTTSKI